MDAALANALKDLENQGAIGLPNRDTVERAANGSRWHGKKKDGDRWFVIKHKSESYNVQW